MGMNVEPETAVAVVGKATYASPIVGGGLTLWTSDILFAILGFAVALIGTVTSVLLNRRMNKIKAAHIAANEARAQREHEMHVQRHNMQMELKKAQLEFFRRPHALSRAEIRAAEALGIDASDFGELPKGGG